MKSDYIDLIPCRHAQKITTLNGEIVGVDLFLHHVNLVAKQLPAKQFALNLCKNRYFFIVAFAAVLLRE